MSEMVLLGDEAVAMGTIHAGMTAGYAYPGTPSTEIMEFLRQYSQKNGKPITDWCTNEKTAYEAALGVSFAGKRTMVCMKHVGLNVAADPFMNSALISIHGGLVIVVADDPGMHSSQNEQDSRYFADFAGIICLEPANQQEAYEMTKEAFDLSEKYHIPVMIRLVTRLAHSRAVVRLADQRQENKLSKAPDPSSWILLPGNARRQWHSLLESQKDFIEFTENSKHNTLFLNKEDNETGVITTGLAKNYYLENLDELSSKPSHLHISAYPFPVKKIRALVEHVKKVIVLEEGYPFLEKYFRGIIPANVEIIGKESGHVPVDGELTPDNIRPVLGLSERSGITLPGLEPPNRPPQLCSGCPHIDSYNAIKAALADYPDSITTSDIGCYTLGALPPYSAIQSCVNMGASVGMAKGAADAGFYPVVAVIGDSTFLHSGVTGLIDAVSTKANMTLVILDNKTTAMTGGQPTILPSSRLEKIVLGIGVDPEHFHVLNAHRKYKEENTKIFKKEFDHKGLSVIIAVRECIETAKKKKKTEVKS